MLPVESVLCSKMGPCVVVTPVRAQRIKTMDVEKSIINVLMLNFDHVALCATFVKPKKEVVTPVSC